MMKDNWDNKNANLCSYFVSLKAASPSCSCCRLTVITLGCPPELPQDHLLLSLELGILGPKPLTVKNKSFLFVNRHITPGKLEKLVYYVPLKYQGRT